jgi:Uma2 family endonuclease
VTLPEEALPATLKLNPELHMSDDEYYEFCMANPDVWFERTAEGEIVIVLPVGLESNDQESEIIEQLCPWAKRDGRGRAFSATTEFILPTGAIVAGRCMGL